MIVLFMAEYDVICRLCLEFASVIRLWVSNLRVIDMRLCPFCQQRVGSDTSLHIDLKAVVKKNAHVRSSFH